MTTRSWSRSSSGGSGGEGGGAVDPGAVSEAEAARALLAADVVVESRRPIPEEVEALVAPGAGAVSRAAQVTELGAMVRRDGDAGADGILLAELKAATAG
ncbi:MAG: hypothetical protein VX017_10420, partial [Pseudomonadota bacterium]|nr:hypothetical protein [Pseudomonadota bacterium]